MAFTSLGSQQLCRGDHFTRSTSNAFAVRVLSLPATLISPLRGGNLEALLQAVYEHAAPIWPLRAALWVRRTDFIIWPRAAASVCNKAESFQLFQNVLLWFPIHTFDYLTRVDGGVPCCSKIFDTTCSVLKCHAVKTEQHMQPLLIALHTKAR